MGYQQHGLRYRAHSACLPKLRKESILHSIVHETKNLRETLALMSARLKKTTLGTAFRYMLEQKWSRPKVVLPALVTTTSSSQDGDIVRLEEVVAKDQPEELWPGDDCGKEALHSVVAGTVTTPASNAGHGARPVMVRRAKARRLNWRIVVGRPDWRHAAVLQWSDRRFGSKPCAYRPIWICGWWGAGSVIDGEAARGQVQAARRMKARSSTSSPMERP